MIPGKENLRKRRGMERHVASTESRAEKYSSHTPPCSLSLSLSLSLAFGKEVELVLVNQTVKLNPVKPIRQYQTDNQFVNRTIPWFVV